MPKRPTHVSPRTYLAASFIVLGAVALRLTANTPLWVFLGGLVAAGALLLIRTTNRWNRQALASFHRQGPRYDARSMLRQQRARMISRGRDGATQGEHE